jgi:hypothetical protein
MRGRRGGREHQSGPGSCARPLIKRRRQKYVAAVIFRGCETRLPRVALFLARNHYPLSHASHRLASPSSTHTYIELHGDAARHSSIKARGWGLATWCMRVGGWVHCLAYLPDGLQRPVLRPGS